MQPQSPTIGNKTHKEGARIASHRIATYLWPALDRLGLHRVVHRDARRLPRKAEAEAARDGRSRHGLKRKRKNPRKKKKADNVTVTAARSRDHAADAAMNERVAKN